MNKKMIGIGVCGVIVAGLLFGYHLQPLSIVMLLSPV